MKNLPSWRNKIFESREWVKPFHTPQMLVLAKGNYFQGKKNEARMGDIFLFVKGLCCKIQICEKQVWVGESHALASDDGASQRKLMCLCAVYQFPADLKSSILADVRSACFGGALTSASSVLALLGRWNDFWWLMISKLEKTFSMRKALLMFPKLLLVAGERKV